MSSRGEPRHQDDVSPCRPHLDVQASVIASQPGLLTATRPVSSGAVRSPVDVTFLQDCRWALRREHHNSPVLAYADEGPELCLPAGPLVPQTGPWPGPALPHWRGRRMRASAGLKSAGLRPGVL